jgi:hypothetical protein
LLHVDKIKLSLSPILEVLEKKKLLEEECVLFAADLILKQCDPHSKDEVEERST